MKQHKDKHNLRNLDDIERAAWFARLAFGYHPDEFTRKPLAKKHTPDFVYNVLNLGC